MLNINRFFVAILYIILIFSIWKTYNLNWWDEYNSKHFVYILFFGAYSIFLLFFKNRLIYASLSILLLFIYYIGIAPVITVICIWITAYLIGNKLLVLTKVDTLNINFFQNSAIGFSIIGLIVTISSHFQINSALYYIFLLVIFYALINKSQTHNLINLTKIYGQSNIKFFPLFILITCIGYLYMVTVLPDLGHDSLSMHLNVPRLIAENLKWGYDIKEYVWSVLPMGVDMLYVPVYIFGGEDAIRLLNLSFMLGSAIQIYAIANRLFSNENIAIFLGLAFLSIPINFYLLGSSFVEPCYIFFILISFSFIIDKVINWYALTIIFGYACTMRITGILFLPSILAFYIYSNRNNKNKYKDLSLIILIFLLFSSIPYIYAYIATGNPVFPLMNEIFKSDYWSKSAFYHPLYVNNLGIANYWHMIFNSQKYGEFNGNGSIGLIFAILIPFQLIYLIYHYKEFDKYKSEIFIFIGGLIYVTSMVYVQAYLRYIFPGLILIYLSFVILLAKSNINLNLIKIILIICIIINILKIPSASTYFPNEFNIYLDNRMKFSYISLHRPYAIVGEILKKFPEYNNSKILLVGHGYDPVYYYFPKNTIAYSWHSPQAFDMINSMPEDLGTAAKKLGVDVIVCPDKQNVDDVKNFSKQCKSISSKIFTTNGVYVGKINQF